MASGWFNSSTPSTRPPDITVQVADREPSTFFLPNSSKSSPPNKLAYDTTHSKTHVASASLFDVGILRDTLAPSFGLHSGLAVIAWGASTYLNRLDAKDWLWPSGQVINAWWSAVGRRLAQGLTLSQALNRLSWHERLVLTGVTLWGGRLFFRIADRSLRRGGDDARYEEVKKSEDFWWKSLFTVFLPEALFQMIISLPFTAPFRHEGAVLMGYHPLVQMAAVGVFSSGLALEALADVQLDAYKAEGGKGILREGVWTIVRHPNYLGDALVHTSFILLLYGSDMLAPLELLGPLANYLFLRFVDGDRGNEAHQVRRYSASQPEKMKQFERFREEKNSFWPKPEELTNHWVWIVLGVGAAGVALEEGLRAVL